MIVLDAINRKLQIVLAGAVATTQLPFVATYVDVGTSPDTFVPTATTGNTNGATPVDAVLAPAVKIQRQIKLLTIYNADTAAAIVSLLYSDFSKAAAGATYVIFKATLQPGQSAVYTDGAGFQVLDSGGSLKPGTGGAISPLEPGGLITSSDLPSIAGAVTLTGVGYFVYFGRTTRAITGNFVEFLVTVAGAGAQTVEVGLFSSATAPREVGLSLAKIVATSSVGGLTSTGVRANNADFSTAIAAGTHLWGGIRTAMATTQPTLAGLTLDYSEGRVQSAAAPGVLTGAGPFAASIIAQAVPTVWQAPDLRLVCT